MYQPPQFRENRVDIMHALMRARPFAALVASGPDGLIANHFPTVLHADEGAHGVLRCHMAKANPLWQSFDRAAEAVAIFQGADSYITPSWYPSKKAHGKVVPTWNYAVVHAHGRLAVVEDPARLRVHVETLTRQQESARPVPWAVGDAPDDFIERQIKGIVGLELTIARLEGKWKASQNRDEADRRGVAIGLEAESGGAASEMAALVAERGSSD